MASIYDFVSFLASLPWLQHQELGDSMKKEMSHDEKTKYYATAPKASAGTIHQLEDGRTRKYWVGKLRGNFICLDFDRWKFDTREEAINEARKFRQSCIDDCKALGIEL